MSMDFKTKLHSGKLAAIQGQMDIVMKTIFGPGWQEDPNTSKTPYRFAKYLAEYCQPLNTKEIFDSVFESPETHPGIVIQIDIPFRMVCSHHLIPATGKASLAYIPHERVIGLSKLARLVDAVGVESPSLQEHIAHRIIDLMKEHLKPKGIMLVIKAEHGCMACRGVNTPGVNTITSHVQGVFRDNPEAKKEALQLLTLH